MQNKKDLSQLQMPDISNAPRKKPQARTQSRPQPRDLQVTTFDDADYEARRRARMKRKEAKRKKLRRRRIILACCAAVLILLVFLLIKGIMLLAGAIAGLIADKKAPVQTEQVVSQADLPIEDDTVDEAEDSVVQAASHYQFTETDATVGLNSDQVLSQYAMLVNAEDHTIVATRNAYDRFIPASMTKVMTLLVACEAAQDLDDTYEITLDVTDFSFANGCSNVGFEVGENVTVRDLMYGTILPSGGDAAYALACYTAGSHEEFVNRMNEKCVELGIGDTTHFTNCVGLYDDNHYSRPYDMAVIMGAAMENELCREVLSARKYTTSLTEQHPEGITISNWFNRRIEDKSMGGQEIGAKTGYVVQSKSCAVSYYEDANGTPYICVTGTAEGGWACIYDHVSIYNIYADGNASYQRSEK